MNESSDRQPRDQQVGPRTRWFTSGWTGLVLVAAGTASLLPAQETGSGEVARRQRAQQQARALATELVSSVLDLQLRQLAENNLQRLPIYADVASMQANLGQLVDTEMQQVIELLEQVEQASPQERQQLVVEARTAVRQIVIALMAERQKLHRRMQLAKLAAQVRQLRDMQAETLDRTRDLGRQPASQREQATLVTREDQRDITAIFGQLVESLREVATWHGPAGEGATRGLQLVEKLNVDASLKNADESLAASRFADAEASEIKIIEALDALLRILEETRGLITADTESASHDVARLMDQQRAIREQTQQANLDDPRQSEELVQKQHVLQQEIQKAANDLASVAEVSKLLERAAEAATESETRLFEADQAAALQQQDEVLKSLSEAAQKLEQSPAAPNQPSAEQLAERMRQLQQLDQSLDAIRSQQREATAMSAPNAAQAKAIEDQVAQELQAANQASDLGPRIESQMAAAEQAVKQAQKALQDGSPAAAEARLQSTQEAQAALDRAAMEVKQTLADARRDRLVDELGALARAADDLQRSAAAERDVAAALATDLANVEPRQAESLAAEQSQVNQRVAEVAQTIEGKASTVEQQLAEVQPSLDAVSKHLQASLPSPPDKTKPPATPTEQQAAAQSAEMAAEKLGAAAEALREEAAELAMQLAQMTRQQAEQLAAMESQEAMPTSGEGTDPGEPVPPSGQPQQGSSKATDLKMAATPSTQQAPSTDSQNPVSDLPAQGQPGDSRTAEDRSTANISSRKLEDEPWFAKLPPAVQQAIHARSRREAPRGYEERLKRYFESIE